MTSITINHCGIYAIQNINNNKIYIGQSTNIPARWRHHKYVLRNGLHNNPYLQRAWVKYGEDSFVFVVLELCDVNDLNQKELFYINKYNSTHRDYGYNMRGGGDSIHCLSPETKEKISKSNLGRIISKESIQKMIESHRGKSSWTDATRKSVSGQNHWSRRDPEKFIDKNNGYAQCIYCLEYNIIFDSINSAAKYCGVDRSNIAKAVRGERFTAGKHKETKEPLHWYGMRNNDCQNYINKSTKEVGI